MKNKRGKMKDERPKTKEEEKKKNDERERGKRKPTSSASMNQTKSSKRILLFWSLGNTVPSKIRSKIMDDSPISNKKKV